jgi:hypothetical protein
VPEIEIVTEKWWPKECLQPRARVEEAREEGLLFRESVNRLLNSLREHSPTARALIEAIRKSRHQVTIYQAGGKVYNVTKQAYFQENPQSPADTLKNKLSYIADRIENVDREKFEIDVDRAIPNYSSTNIRKRGPVVDKALKQPQIHVPLGQILDRWLLQLGPEVQFDNTSRVWFEAGQGDSQSQYAALTFRALMDAADRAQHAGRITYKDLGEICGGRRFPFLEFDFTQLSLAVKRKLTAVLEDFLDPTQCGAGMPCSVILNVKAKHVSPEMKKFEDTGDGPVKIKPDMGQAWYYRPVSVGLAHELVHAWRIINGRCVYKSASWEDEAMVIGLNPFLNVLYSENKVRTELKLAQRPEANATPEFD